MPVKTKKRRWSQIGLRSLLILVTLCAILAAWKSRADRQRKLIDMITQHGGKVGYDYQVDPITGAFKPGTDDEANWLLRLVGPDYWRHVCRVDAPSKSLSDISGIKSLADLTNLNLRSAPVTDIAALKELHKLQTLDIVNSSISNIEPLRNNPSLRELHARVTGIVDIEPLANVITLERLYIGKTKVADVSSLGNLRHLERLDLANTPVTDASVLAKLTSLKECHLDDHLKDSVRTLKVGNADCKVVFSPREN